MARMTACTRSITSLKSNSARADAMPNSFERAICASSFAERISALDGTQPVFRQSPPMRFFSTNVTLAFTAAAM